MVASIPEVDWVVSVEKMFDDPFRRIEHLVSTICRNRDLIYLGNDEFNQTVLCSKTRTYVFGLTDIEADICKYIMAVPDKRIDRKVFLQ